MATPWHRVIQPTLLHVVAIAVGFAATFLPAAHGEARWADRFIDPVDGQFDLSEHLLTHRGLLPVPIIITEPALGYGGGLAALWFRESIQEADTRARADFGRRSPPAIAAVGGFGTENGSWGAFAGYFVPLAEDRYRYVGGIAKVGLDLDYYDLGGRPSAYTLDGSGLLQQFLARIGDSNWFVGGRYAYLDTESRFQRERGPEIPQRDLDLRIGRLSLIVDYDSRDNIFTPSRGTFMEAELARASEALGGTVDFNSFYVRAFHYLELSHEWVIGLRGDLRLSGDSTPFFAKPFVSLRGVPALRYQDDRAAVAEVEARWNFTSRWALVGFVGAGRAYGGRVDWSDAESVVAGGVGVRYLIARRLGLFVGADVARGPEESAFYVQVGSAWR